MSDLDASTPRVFLIRHGETEWSKSGRYTGKTDIELTEHGKKQVMATGAHLVGPKKLIDPSRVACSYVSPRTRTKDTFELLFADTVEAEIITNTEDIAEWDYGDYEGLKIAEIQKLRESRGLDQDSKYNIWSDGCERGESRLQVTERLDRLISTIKAVQEPLMSGDGRADVVVVAHGLILRAFVKRWLGYPVDFPMSIMMSPGAISILSYKNHNIDEPALHIGMSLPLVDTS